MPRPCASLDAFNLTASDVLAVEHVEFSPALRFPRALVRFVHPETGATVRRTFKLTGDTLTSARDRAEIGLGDGTPRPEAAWSVRGFVSLSDVFVSVPERVGRSFTVRGDELRPHVAPGVAVA